MNEGKALAFAAEVLRRALAAEASATWGKYSYSYEGCCEEDGIEAAIDILEQQAKAYDKTESS